MGILQAIFLFLRALLLRRAAAAVEKLSNLWSLSLCNTDVDDLGLKHLARLTSLETLSLWNTQVGDAGLEHVSGLTNLRNLVLDGTGGTTGVRSRYCGTAGKPGG